MYGGVCGPDVRRDETRRGAAQTRNTVPPLQPQATRSTIYLITLPPKPNHPSIQQAKHDQSSLEIYT